ncbi:hypothetical protein J7T55_010924 [Diaporthe amygdali]|uniref:uncharacterized protein n=1 Tax=Phomopsis amygdali TaxID=1214568 RepID=UPI0022FE44BF|nr:uncharacterized protein J7T55_010924 [Diaporthe amygdali]KAJ0104458.1 hypothetical protein J7T55_010924 [Diaporthe amygdali]
MLQRTRSSCPFPRPIVSDSGRLSWDKYQLYIPESGHMVLVDNALASELDPVPPVLDSMEGFFYLLKTFYSGTRQYRLRPGDHTSHYLTQHVIKGRDGVHSSCGSVKDRALLFPHRSGDGTGFLLTLELEVNDQTSQADYLARGNRPEIDLQCGREPHQSVGDTHFWGLIALEALRYVFRKTCVDLTKAEESVSRVVNSFTDTVNEALSRSPAGTPLAPEDAEQRVPVLAVNTLGPYGYQVDEESGDTRLGNRPALFETNTGATSARGASHSCSAGLRGTRRPCIMSVLTVTCSTADSIRGRPSTPFATIRRKDSRGCAEYALGRQHETLHYGERASVPVALAILILLADLLRRLSFHVVGRIATRPTWATPHPANAGHTQARSSSSAEWKRVMNDPVELLQYFGLDATKQAGMIETLI